jgi:DNA-binding MarR family transcriptional regulator
MGSLVEWVARARRALSQRLGRFLVLLGLAVVVTVLVAAPPLGAAVQKEVMAVPMSGDTLAAPSGVEARGAEASVMLAPLYLRIPEPQLLNSSMRGEIYSAIVMNPGLTFTQVRAQVGTASGTLQHHLRVLERGGAVRRVRVGKYTRFYPATQRALRLSPPEERIARALAETGGSTQASLGRMLGMSRQLVHYHVGHLEERGVVVREWTDAGGPPVVRLAVPLTPRAW